MTRFAFSSRVAVTKDRADGFTLVELLVVIAVLSVLCGLLVPMHASGSRQSGLMQCKNNLKQVGMAIDMYAKDHQDYLPGRTWMGVYSIYNQTYTWSMGYYLWSYLNAPPPPSGPVPEVEVSALTCPASVQLKQQPINNAGPARRHVSFIVTPRVDGTVTEPTIFWPFGNIPAQTPTVQTSAIRRPSETWAMQDADRESPQISSGADYYPYLSDPVHNDRPGESRESAIQRNNLFFDSSVRPVITPN
jgi:prepilin-type N-terminal cleavage/methylation domain-containing protein